MEKDQSGKDDASSAKNQRAAESSSRAHQSNSARNHGNSNGGTTVSAMIANSASQANLNSSAAASSGPSISAEREFERQESSISLASITLSDRSGSTNSLSVPIIPVTSAPNTSQAFAGQGNAPYNWQASKPAVKERLAYIMNTEIMSDIQFRVGKPPNTQLIPAHKFLLCVGSAVFDAQFNSQMATKESVIEIPDVEPAAFLALLKFLYHDEVNIGPETVMTTLYTAKKYAVPALEKACVEFLKRNLSSDNAFMLLTQARLFDEPQLAALCLESIDKSTSEALNAEGFTDIDHETLCVVLERDTLGIRESKLCTAVFRWSEAECRRRNQHPTPENQRLALGRALRLIRFPLMSIEEFAMGPAQSGILEDKEIVELFLYFTVNPKPATHFQDVPRCCLTGKEQVVSRFCQIESRWGYSGTSDRIRFMVNRRIFVVGFGLYGSIHGATEYQVNIQGPDSYYGSKGLRKVTHESVSGGKVTFQFHYAAGNNNGTSVEDGQVPEIIFYT
ncbi:BTB/POZ domain-containing protein 2-like isoform X2 [Dreissena polymorpha]|uniref:BTB/POZ domain-containing protein 2-like isoform X2 n=1 Tax=Dreissena polymorpha TaxID=45954 RepID=UPI002263EC18|nr:BTB/POZ domain-containing protein 2-like isoform X2 [Dreissena polymorpha]